jgi:hypothetical protein
MPEIYSVGKECHLSLEGYPDSVREEVWTGRNVLGPSFLQITFCYPSYQSPDLIVLSELFLNSSVDIISGKV